ncbi:hypothetical protein EDD86DRAFT_187730 [Gorgonomyces haynaldii]|nr:hypothetical protein EDD86DRAFT_187730 [Gorgonomyces haynaldii]
MIEIIRLLESDGETIMDSVSAEYEDSFCLDTFGDLAKSHAQADPKGTKSFIIARVQTWDPKQPEKAFYSYYNAFHLNKVLFQTQNYMGKRYIHRLHVLNPLTNSDIIGNVLYFQINNATIADDDTVAIPVDDSAKQNQVKKSQSVARSMKASASIKSENWTMAAPVANEVEDEQPQEMPSPTDKRPSIMERISKPFRNTVTRPSDGPKDPDSGGILSPETTVRQEGDALKITMTIPNNGHRPSMTVEAKAPVSPIKKSVTSRKEAPAGIITRFNVPVSKEQIEAMTPLEPQERRRSLSYANMMSASGEKPTIQEWISTMQSESEDSPKSANRLRPSIHDILEEPEEDKSDAGSKTNELAEQVHIINATLVGTDNDFLETSKMRAFFRSHALMPEDAKLFEMPAYTGEAGTPGSVHPPEPEYALWELCCTPSPQTLSNATPCMRRFHLYKCYALAIAFAIFILSFIIAVVLVANQNLQKG